FAERAGKRSINAGSSRPPLAQTFLGSEQQRASASCVASSNPGMAERRGSQTPHARQPTERPLTPNDGVVVERGERQALCSPPVSARGTNGRKRRACTKGIETEVPGPSGHPPGMPPRRAKADPLCVEGDSVRPLGHRRPKRSVAGARRSG